MKKINKIILLLITLFLTSCSNKIGNSSNQTQINQVDGYPFNYFAEFTYNNDNYQILFPSNNEYAIYYRYLETDYTTEMKYWTINYLYESPYVFDKNFNEKEIINLFYETLIEKEDEIESLVERQVNISAPYSKEEEEISLINPFDQKINLVIVDILIPLRLQNIKTYESYTISLPLNRLYLAKCEDKIENLKKDEIISWTDFLKTTNLSKY